MNIDNDKESIEGDVERGETNNDNKKGEQEGEWQWNKEQLKREKMREKCKNLEKRPRSLKFSTIGLHLLES